MIKIPGTREGWPAIERCLFEGININVTLLFSVEHYRAVAEAWLRALEARVEQGKPIQSLASVASFFVSRVDTEVDKHIQATGGSLLPLQGKTAIASAQREQYVRYRDEIIPQALDVERLAEDAYRLGRTGIAAYLQALQATRDVRLRSLQAQADLQAALTDLERAIGAPVLP